MKWNTLDSVEEEKQCIMSQWIDIPGYFMDETMPNPKDLLICSIIPTSLTQIVTLASSFL